MKKACMSNCKDPENRSKKKCVCGGHSTYAKKPRRKDKRIVCDYSGPNYFQPDHHACAARHHRLYRFETE